jgi:hypothetical protein
MTTHPQLQKGQFVWADCRDLGSIKPKMRKCEVLHKPSAKGFVKLLRPDKTTMVVATDMVREKRP